MTYEIPDPRDPKYLCDLGTDCRCSPQQMENCEFSIPRNHSPRAVAKYPAANDDTSDPPIWLLLVALGLIVSGAVALYALLR